MSNFEAQPPQNQPIRRQPLPNRYGDESPELEAAPSKSASHDRSTNEQESLLGQVSKALKSITPTQQNRTRQLMPMFKAKTQKEGPTKQREEFINEVRGKIGKKDTNNKDKVTHYLSM
jgi:tRNA C32,U32 (ribose-2'-O)-methylase TrmJ